MQTQAGGQGSSNAGPASSAIVQAASKSNSKPVTTIKVGKMVKVYDRAYWLNPKEAAGTTGVDSSSSTSSSTVEWFPAIIYKDVQEAIKDMQIEGKMKMGKVVD